MWTFAGVCETTMPLAVWISRILLECRIIFFSPLFGEEKPITCNEAPLSTMYLLSVECIAKPVAVFFTFCGDVASEEVCFVDIAVVSFCLEDLFVKLVSPCFVKIFLLLLPLCGLLVIRWCIWRSFVFAARLDHVQICEFVSDFTSIQTLMLRRPILLLRVSKWAILSDLAINFPDVFAMRVDANNHTLGRDNEFLLCSWKHGGRCSFPDGLCPVFLTHCRSAESSLFLIGLLDRFFLLFPFFAVSCPNKHLHEPFDIQDRQYVPCSSALVEEYAAAAVSWSFFFFEKSIWFAGAVRECN